MGEQMKIMVLAVAAATVASPAFAQKTPLERDAIVSNTKDLPRATMVGLIDPAVGMIRARGWRCDSVSAIQQMILGDGFSVVCNQYRYRYEFKDRGGNWEVQLK